MENVGVPTYQELVIVARRQDLAKGGERVRRFMRALGQGQAALRADPEAGVAAAAEGQPRPRARAAARERQGAPCPPSSRPPGKPFGWMEPVEWARYGDWMYSNKLLSRPPNAARALTDEFLPGQGLADSDSGSG